MGFLSELLSLLRSLTKSDDRNDSIGEAVNTDDVELERRECDAQLELLEHELDQAEETFENILDRARSAENQEPLYKKALTLLDDFEQKQSKYESVAEEYVILSTLMTVAEQYEDVPPTTLDRSDGLSDRQRTIVQKLSQDQRVQEIQRVLDRRIDHSEIPDEYRVGSDEIGYDFTNDDLDHADRQRDQPGMAWFDQIADVILLDDNIEDPEYSRLQDERSDTSVL